MGAFLLRRIPRAIVVLIAISSIVFITTHLSGNVVGLMLGERADPKAREDLIKELGLDRPLIVQFGDFWKDILTGDWGDSLWRHQPALKLVRERLPATVELAAAAFIVSMSLSIPAGIFAAMKRGSKWDQLVMSVAVVGQAWPSFWMGIIFILVFAVQLGWLPTHGRAEAVAWFGRPELHFTFYSWDGIKHLIMPAVVLSFLPMAIMARITRSAMLEVLRQDYIRTARAKGLHERMVLFRHAIKNAAIPVVTIMGLETGFFLAGAVITETVFAWPGLGREAIEAIQKRDFPVIQAVVVVISSIFVFVNLGVDMLYGYLDPRIRYS